MKRHFTVLLTGLICVLGAGVSNVAAQVSFSAGIQINSANDFAQPLTPLGSWSTVGSYGRCWRPSHVAASWRPYSDGRWQWTDVGWYWVSDEPWAWATYHYGSWANDASLGWVWIPGTEWAPAWVSWRESSDYIGWCPFGPGGVVLSPSLFIFVDMRRFHSPIRPNTIIVNNPSVISRTRVMSTSFRHETRTIGGARRQVVVNVGPSTETVARATGTQFTPQPITEVVRETPVPQDVPRTGDIERPVLKEQNVEQWRERSTRESKESPAEKPLPPTGREEPKVTPPPPGATEPQKPQSPTPETQPPEAQKPEPSPPDVRPVPSVPPKPEQVRPDQPAPTSPEHPLPPTGREQPPVTPQPPPEEKAKPQQGRPEQRPNSPGSETPIHVRPDQPVTRPPQKPLPPTGREQPSVQPPSSPSPEQVQPPRVPSPPEAPPTSVLPPTGREQPPAPPPPSEQPKPPPPRPEPKVQEPPPPPQHPAPPPAAPEQPSKPEPDQKKEKP